MEITRAVPELYFGPEPDPELFIKKLKKVKNRKKCKKSKKM